MKKDAHYFSAWDHELLARLAAEQTEQIKQLQADLKAALEAYRREVQK
jgi:hypothetical protein